MARILWHFLVPKFSEREKRDRDVRDDLPVALLTSGQSYDPGQLRHRETRFGDQQLQRATFPPPFSWALVGP